MYEKTFNPADYDVDVKTILDEENRQRSTLEPAIVVTPAAPETISGFRVQVLFTQEIDQANQLKENLANAVPDDWVYVVYEAPYYKVRVGNFADRSTANQMVRKLVSIGYKDAWIVPDNVMKNPPPKPPETFIEPEKQLEQHR
ncbi:MAG: SPOR domain-containing protein [Ignavibacteria bacterium]|nr:SPOR domain-containing protein [Ignavibacteria bacterium]